MISIITAIFGQLDMNKLFYESLERYTEQPFELIIVDNSSTDGSREYFESKGAKVISTGGNYSYPYCQNLGMRYASYDFLAFLNNDIILSPGWDVHAMQIMKKNGLEIASACATDRMQDKRMTRRYRKIWSIIKKTFLFLFGPTYNSLKMMHFVMFPDWESFSKRRYKKYGDSIVEGFAGCNILAFRSVFDKVGLWDERIQGADFEMYLRTKKRSLEHGDIKPIHLMKGIYLHHYIRLTSKNKATPSFTDKDNLIRLHDKWPIDEFKQLTNGVTV